MLLAEVRGKYRPESKFVSTGPRTHNHQVMGLLPFESQLPNDYNRPNDNEEEEEEEANEEEKEEKNKKKKKKRKTTTTT